MARYVVGHQTLECDALHNQLRTQLEKVVEERERLKTETAYLVEQSRSASSLRADLEAKVRKMNEVFA